MSLHSAESKPGGLEGVGCNVPVRRNRPNVATNVADVEVLGQLLLVEETVVATHMPHSLLLCPETADRNLTG
jgi:hypothetical protein